MTAEETTPVGADFEVRFTDHAISLYRRGTEKLLWQIEWQAIEEIIAWKWDLFAVDRICIGFAWARSDVLKMVDEEMIGWDRLQAAIEKRFGVRQSDWWRDVAFPAFAENRRVIWKRS